MDFEDLTCDQFSRLHRGLFPGVNYLARILIRIDQQNFPHNDPLRLKVQAAYDACLRLSDFMHHQSCASGSVARAPRRCEVDQPKRPPHLGSKLKKKLYDQQARRRGDAQ